MGSKQLFLVAGLAGLVGAALLVAAADMGARPVVSAETLSGELDGRLRDAVTAITSRADTLAALPSLHDSVSTDAETVRDQTQRERSFQPRPGETITIAQVPNVGDPALLLVLPDGATPVEHPEREGARFVMLGGELQVVDVVFITPSEPSRAAELKGALAMRAAVSFAGLDTRLEKLGAGARVVLEGKELHLGVAKAGRTDVSFPLTLGGGIASRVRATATVPTVDRGTVPRAGGVVAVLVCFASLLLGVRLRRHPHLEPRAAIARSDAPTLAVPPPTDRTGPPSLAPPPVILEGTIIDGTYEIVQLIGKGGMGTVWEARHLRLPDKRVAIKILTVEGQTEEHLSRFRREADITSRLGHPNIVSVIDFNNLPTGAPYIVLEFLVGETLAGRIERGPVPLAETLDLAKQIASALHAAHKAGIVHRDLKPENVFLVPTGRGAALVKVLDFGISKIRGNVIMQTQDSLVFGTPQYMSPEQASGKNSAVDARADVWALGTIVHEMLMGTVAFTGDTMTSLLVSVLVTPSPSLRGQPGVPEHVALALDQALAKDPSRRWPDMPSFIAALEGSLTQSLY